MFAEESLETRLVCTQETGEIPPQESDSAANWLGMLRPVFVTACCFRCLGKHPLSLAEHLCKCSLRCRCSAQTPFLPHIGGISPYAVSCLSFPYSKSPLNSVSDAHCPFFLFFIPPHPTPPSVLGSLQEKHKGLTCASSPGPHTLPYIKGLFLITAGHIQPSPPQPAGCSQVLLLSTVLLLMPPKHPISCKHQDRRMIKSSNFRSGSVLHHFLLVYMSIDGGRIKLLLSKSG